MRIFCPRRKGMARFASIFRTAGGSSCVVLAERRTSIGWIMSDVDVIVLDATGGGEMLRQCLQSIAGAREVIVFDNGSPSPIRLEGARVIRSETNIGFAAGVNAAFHQTNAPYVALINNDVILDRDWIDVTSRALDSDAKMAAVQTIIRRDAKTIDGAGIDISHGTFRQIGFGLPIASALPAVWRESSS